MPMMPQRKLGSSDVEISDIGLGCWGIGGPFWDRGGWMGYGATNDAESIRALHRALDLGVTFFDTADVYGCGHSERLIGEAFAGRPERVVLSTKFGFTFDENERKVTGIDATPEGIRRSCEASLRRLRREVLDVYTFQLWDHPLERIDEVIRTLDALVDEGKVRTYAWLTDDVGRARRFAQSRHCVALPQLLNLFENSPALIALCEELNLAALTRRPLAMGLLTGKFTPGSQFADNDMRRRFGWNFKDGKQAALAAKLERLRGVLTEGGRTLAQGALGWVWARSRMAVPVPGFKSVAQVEENVGAVRFGPLTARQMRAVDELLNPPAAPPPAAPQ